MADQIKDPQSTEVEEVHDQQTPDATGDSTGQNDSPKAVEGAVEGGWNGSVAGTNDALEPDKKTS